MPLFYVKIRKNIDICNYLPIYYPAICRGWGTFSVPSFGKDSKRLFFYRRSRTFFTAVGRFLPRGVFWSHAPHDCGCGGGDTKENLFSDCRRRHSHKGEAFRRRYGFLYLSHPYGNHPHPHFVCCHRKQMICYMFFGHQTIISLRFVISFCI